MNGKDGTSYSKPLSEIREDLADYWEGPEVEMTAAEREIWIKELNESLEKARRDIAAGRGIPAEIVMARMRKRYNLSSAKPTPREPFLPFRASLGLRG